MKPEVGCKVWFVFKPRGGRRRTLDGVVVRVTDQHAQVRAMVTACPVRYSDFLPRLEWLASTREGAVAARAAWDQRQQEVRP